MVIITDRRLARGLSRNIPDVCSDRTEAISSEIHSSLNDLIQTAYNGVFYMNKGHNEVG